MAGTGIAFGSVELNNFITVASGPLTDAASKIEAAEKAGAGAASLKLTFVDVPFQSEMRSYSMPGSVILSPTNRRLDLKKAIEITRQIRRITGMKLFANYSALGSRLDEWKLLSEKLDEAGADLLEPNFCCPNLDTSEVTSTTKHDHGGASIGENPEVCAEIVRAIREVSGLPIVPKIITADRRTLIEVARTVEDCGAAGIHVVGTPTSGLPPVAENGRPEIPLLDGAPQGSTNGPLCKYTSYLYAAILARSISIPIMISGGLESWKDCVDVISWGATAPSICSAFMWYGYEILDSINEGIQDFMDRNGFASIADFRGRSLRYFTTPDRVRLRRGVAVVDDEACINCGRCLRPAHCEAVSRADDRVAIDAELCIGCGVCGSLCPVGAISYREEEEH